MQRPAHQSTAGFGGRAWHGPSVTLRFESAQPPREVYAFYDEQARQRGWTPGNLNALQMPSSWRKLYSNGALAWVSLFTDEPWDATPRPRRYELAAGITLPAWGRYTIDGERT